MENEDLCERVESSSRRISLGVGATADCNLGCPHCYSQHLRGSSLSLDQLKDLVEGRDKKVASVNFGTGENILNPEFPNMVKYCHQKGIKQSLTSNGFSIDRLPDEVLSLFNDLDISLDFMDKQEQNTFRKGGSWNFVDRAIKKCQRLGLEFSITTALMNINHRQVPLLLAKAGQEDCNLRLNIFKPVPKNGNYKFQLSYEQFWESVGLLCEYGEVVSCSEPLVNALLGIPQIVPQSPCGLESLRVHPDGEVMPCVYWVNADEDGKLRDIDGQEVQIPGKGAMPLGYWTTGKVHMDDLDESFKRAFENPAFREIRTIPDYCQTECNLVEACGGGCASRRYLNGALNEPDMYCPIAKGKDIPDIEVTMHAGEKDLVHASYLCTFIFRAKPGIAEMVKDYQPKGK